MKRVEALRPPLPPESPSKLPRLASPRGFKVKAAVSCDSAGIILLEGREIAKDLVLERAQVKMLQEKARMLMSLMKDGESTDADIVGQLQEAHEEREALEQEIQDLTETYCEPYSEKLLSEIETSREKVRENQKLLKDLEAQIGSKQEELEAILASDAYLAIGQQENQIKTLNKKLNDLGLEEQKAMHAHQLFVDEDPALAGVNQQVIALQKRLDDLALIRSRKVSELADLRRAKSRREMAPTRNRNERAKSRRKMSSGKEQKKAEPDQGPSDRSPRKFIRMGYGNEQGGASPRRPVRRATDNGQMQSWEYMEYILSQKSDRSVDDGDVAPSETEETGNGSMAGRVTFVLDSESYLPNT